MDELDRLVSEVRKTTDHVDILMANAGATWGEKFDTHPEHAFSKVMDLNVKSVFYCVQKYVPSLISYLPSMDTNRTRFTPLLTAKASVESPSRVIITGSVAGIGVGVLGDNATFSYSASKAAANHLAKNLALELGPRGVLCNAIAPGFFPSKMASGILDTQGGIDAVAKLSPNGRLGKPEDIAGTVVFLSSRAGSHLNGTVVVLDGGNLLKGRL